MFTLTSQQREVADLIVNALNLEIRPDDVNPEAPLFYDGLGLDSIDALEIALELSKKYGFELRSDDEQNATFFGSLRALTDFIQTKRTV